MYRGGEYTVVPKEGETIGKQFADAVQNLPEGILAANVPTPEPETVNWLSGFSTLGQMLNGFTDFGQLVPGFFTLFVVGEGIEKKSTDFAAEVMAQAAQAR